MSVPVELEQLSERIEEYGPVAYLVTIGEGGQPHVVSVCATLDGAVVRTGAGRATLENVVARPDVTLLWPAPPGRDYALIVDGDAARGPDDESGATLAVSATAAVLHRTPLGDPASPSCVRVLAAAEPT
jgi:hypothetical protein